MNIPPNRVTPRAEWPPGSSTVGKKSTSPSGALGAMWSSLRVELLELATFAAAG